MITRERAAITAFPKGRVKNFLEQHVKAKSFLPSPNSYNIEKAYNYITLGARSSYRWLIYFTNLVKKNEWSVELHTGVLVWSPDSSWNEQTYFPKCNFRPTLPLLTHQTHWQRYLRFSDFSDQHIDRTVMRYKASGQHRGHRKRFCLTLLDWCKARAERNHDNEALRAWEHTGSPRRNLRSQERAHNRRAVPSVWPDGNWSEQSDSIQVEPADRSHLVLHLPTDEGL